MGIAREVEMDIGGRIFNIASDDNYIDNMQGGFEPDMVALFRSVANGSNVILDVGANIGCTALLFGGMAQKVYAFEPAASTYSFLERNIARSGLSTIQLRNVGLGAEPGQFKITYSPFSRAGAFVSNQIQVSAGHEEEQITIRTLDQEVKDLRLGSIDFIKIDVEGFEGSVLRGGPVTLSTFKPLVVLELNHWCLNAFQRTSIPDFFDLLKAIFPVLYAIEGSTYMNLHHFNDSYAVMYHHLLKMRYLNIVAGFDDNRLENFKSQYRHEGII